jgi:hypothetical protein
LRIPLDDDLDQEERLTILAPLRAVDDRSGPVARPQADDVLEEPRANTLAEARGVDRSDLRGGSAAVD